MRQDHFDLLEAELRAAVPRAATTPPGRRPRRPRRAGGSAVGLGLAVATCVAVVVVAVALLGHRVGHRPDRPSPTVPSVATAPTLGQLERNFAVLRRHQTAADRAWDPAGGPGLIAGLTRLARRLPGGQRVFLTVDRGAPHTLRLWVVDRDGDTVGTSFTAGAAGFGVLPIPTPAPGPATTRWTGLVPDGVASVQWTFACPARRACSALQRRVPVRGNVGSVPVPGTGGCADAACRTVTSAIWFVRSAEAMSFDRATAKRMTAAPFVEPFLVHLQSRPIRAVVALRGNGLSSVRFGATPAALDRLVEPALGPPSPTGGGTGTDCGVDRTLTWPIVIDPVTGRVRRSVTLLAFFAGDRFVGYQYGSSAGAATTGGRALLVGVTGRGLRLGDTIARGRRLYGPAFHTSYAQGGTWRVRTAQGRLEGYAYGNPPRGSDIGARSEITSIDAGDVGCPAVSP